MIRHAKKNIFLLEKQVKLIFVPDSSKLIAKMFFMNEE